MRISKTELGLLTKALVAIKEPYRELLQNILISLAETTPWFKDYLFNALQGGLTFSIGNRNAAASYELKENNIVIRESYFNSSLPAEVIKEFFRIMLRHEVTHAVDYKSMRGNEYQSSLIGTRMKHYIKLTKALYNNLGCVDRNFYVNPKALDELAVLLQSTSEVGQLTYGSSDNLDNVYGMYQLSINTLGTYVNLVSENLADRTSLLRYVTKIWRASATEYLSTHILDPVMVESRFRAAQSFRDSNNLAVSENIFREKFFDRRPFAMWVELSEQQRKVLDLLYTLRLRMHANFGYDQFCFSQFNACLETENNNCLLILLTCQKIYAPDEFFRSKLEMSAVLRERVDAHLMDLDTLDRLCVVPMEKLNRQPAARSSLMPAIFYSIGFGFVDELAMRFMLDQKFPIVGFGRAIVNIAFLCLLNLFNFLSNDEESVAALQLGMITAVLLLRFGFESLLKEQLSPTAQSVASHVMTGALLAPQAITEGIQQTGINLAVGAVGSFAGAKLAHSMSRAFGWKDHAAIEKVHNALLKRISDIADTDLEKFAAFKKSIAAKNYSQALRRACTSNVPEALPLVQILLAYKNSLSIDINEAAGEKMQTAIHQAALKGNREIYDYLVNNRADFNKLDAAGITAAQYLESFNAKSEIQDSVNFKKS